MENLLIAYCGLDCEKCDAYLATVHNDAADCVIRLVVRMLRARERG